jgi:hypothetical protein
MTRETEIILGNVESGNGFDGCMKDVRLNGKMLARNESGNAIITKSNGMYGDMAWVVGRK